MSTANQIDKESPRIIIADDDPCFTEMLEFALNRAGMHVIATVHDGKQAIDTTIQQKPDCLLLDIAMPRVDGFAALSNIKYLSPETHIVVVSALKDPNCRTRALELGANAFFLKGDSIVEDLTSIIHTLIVGECPPSASKSSLDPIFPATPQVKLLLEDQEFSSL